MELDDYENELLDLVDQRDNVIGTITHAEAFDIMQTKRGYLRASNGFIMNSDGKLWIPRRQPNKRIAPGALDYSMGEHVQSGESYIDAAVRGFKEELNLDVDAKNLLFLGKLAPTPGQPPYFVSDYLLYSDSTPDYNSDDFQSAEWITPAALKIRLETKADKGKASLIQSLESLLRYQADSKPH